MSKEKIEKLEEDLAVAHGNISSVAGADALYRVALERIEYLEAKCEWHKLQEEGLRDDIPEIEAERDRVIDQLREVQKIADMHRKRYERAEADLVNADRAFTVLDVERIALRAGVEYLLSVANKGGKE